MRLSFSTNAFIRYSVCEAVKKIASIGYEGVEILADVPHMYMGSAKKADIARLKDVLDSSGLAASNINANTARGYSANNSTPLFEPTLASSDERVRRWRVDYTKKCVDLAAALGAPNVSVTSGQIPPGSSPEEALEQLKKSLEEIALYAQKTGVKVGLEYEPGYLIEYCFELAFLINEVNSGHFGANLDIGHSHIAGEDPEEVFKTLGEKVFHMHLEDIKDRRHFHLIPGLGDIDFERVLGLGAKYSYSGFAAVELYTYPHEPELAAATAFEYLKAFDVWDFTGKEVR